MPGGDRLLSESSRARSFPHLEVAAATVLTLVKFPTKILIVMSILDCSSTANGDGGMSEPKTGGSGPRLAGVSAHNCL